MNKKVPSERDWFNGPYDDDVNFAYKHLFGKSIAEAIPYFAKSPISRADELLLAPAEVFQYYIFAFSEYILSIDYSNFKDDYYFSESANAADAANAFLGLLESKLDDDSEAILPIMDELIPVINYIASHQNDFGADHDIYGDFESIKDRLLEKARQ